MTFLTLKLLLLSLCLHAFFRSSETTTTSTSASASASSSSSSGTINETAVLVVFKVGVVLDLDTVVGRVGQSCLLMALSDFYSLHTNYTTRLTLQVRDSRGQVIDAAAAAIELLKDVEVDAIVGPQKSAQANFVMDLGDKSRVPIISFSATSPSMPSQTPYFVQTGLSDDAQVGAISAIVEAFRWREVVLIYEDTDYGSGIIPYLCNAFEKIHARIAYRSTIPLSATNDFIGKELYKMMTKQTRVFVVHMSCSHSLGTRLFLKAKRIGMMSNGYVWIITNGLMDSIHSSDSSVVEAMQGVLGVRPLIPQSKELDSFEVRWKKKFLQDNPATKQAEMSVFGLWAYDTVWALATAAEKVGVREPVINPDNKTMNSTQLLSFGISQTGPKLLKAISETTFEGLSGEFDLVNGRLLPSAFQILNVVRKGEKEVGIWTEPSGIFWEFNTNGTDSSTNPKQNFRGIVWPGETALVPKGWEIPVSGKKLKVGVPVKKGFTEFVKVQTDPQTGKTEVSGLCIDLFDAVIKKLPYAVPHEYIPFKRHAHDSGAGSYYDDLVQQVYLQKLDAAVGDITITANRSSYVDFTLPFAEGGVSMIVPTKYEDRNGIWTFLKPLNMDLWATTIAFFVLTGFAVWVLEHRINAAFRGPPSHHVGMILWFPLSGEKVISNLARLVVAVWLFAVLILSSGYTASLSSRLTVQRLQPAVTDWNQLVKNRDTKVGHPYGSFIASKLIEMGFKQHQLQPQMTEDQCDQALIRGSRNGGISAFFDNVPWTKQFVSKYCPQYMAVGPVYWTEGFGFVFPKGSPLVADVSRALITLLEGDKKFSIEQGSCTVLESDSITSNSLSLQSFKGIFAITGCVIVFCLLVYLAKYIRENRDHLKGIPDSGTTTWSRIRAMCWHFDQRDLSSYPFSRKENQDQVLELTPDVGIGNSSVVFISDTSAPSLPRNSSSSSGMATTLSLEEMDDEATDDQALEDPVNSEHILIAIL